MGSSKENKYYTICQRIRLITIHFKHKNAEVNRKQNNSRIAKKVNWDKVDKEWNPAHIRTHIDSLQVNENVEETAIEQALLKL
jgi:hypothetical protein